MSKVRGAPLYVQASGALPGQQFLPSGLYALTGHAVGGKFIRATRPQPLRTMAQLMAEHPPQRWRCPMCLSYLPVDVNKACPHCGYSESTGPQPEGDRHTPPRLTMLDRIVAEQRRLGLRPADPEASLTTMKTQTPRRCERCGKTYAVCSCPPPAPRTLDLAVKRQAVRLQVHEQACRTAGYRPLERGETV